ncbi:MAG TPA: tetratricopeptide repeat protein [Tepidisphaeraceae bacterium]|jgi:TolA-binding protein|nr:tetratricopeptide repeat protein [Tepidisphaeraceae bacterium]
MSLTPMEWHASPASGRRANRCARARRALAFLAVAGMFALSIPALTLADAPAAADQPVDPAAKQLTAANGLYDRGLFKLAADQYQAFLQQYPKNLNALAAHYALGMCDYRLNNFAQAITDLQPVLADEKFDPKDQALMVTGYCQLQLKQYDKASASFSDLLAKFPKSKLAESAGLFRVQAAYFGNQPQQAIDAATLFTRQFPTSPQQPANLYFKALAQRRLQQNDQAVATLADLTKNHPDSSYQTDAFLLSGQTHEAMGQSDAAIADYQQMLASAPAARKSEAGYVLGVAEYKAGKYAESATALLPVANETPPGLYAKPARLELGWSQFQSGKIPDARATFAAVIKDDPDNAAQAKYALAQCDIAQKQYEPAEKALAELAQAKPAPANLPQILLDRAVCLMELGKFDAAQQPLADLAADHPIPAQSAEAAYRQAYCFNKLGKFDQSHAACQRVAKLPPSDFARPARELDAENLFQLGSYGDAESAFTALKSDAAPAQQSRLALRIGQCEYYSAHYDKAAAALAPLAAGPQTAADPTLRPALFLYGDALLQQGKNADAAGALGKYLAAAGDDAPDLREAQFKLALAQLHNNQPDAARQSFASLAAGPDGSPYVQRGLFEVGQLDYKSGKLEPAAASLNRLLAVHPPAELAAPTLYLLGWIDFDSKRFAPAAEKWKAVADKYPDSKLADDAAYQQAVALRQATQYGPALAAVADFIKAHPHSPNIAHANELAADVLYDQAWAQRAGKDMPAAIASYQQLLKEHPDSPLANPVRAELAEVLFNQKDYKGAEPYLQAVLADKSADPKLLAPAHYRLAWCYSKLAQPDKAAAEFETFSNAAPGTDNDLAESALYEAGVVESTATHYDRAEQLFDLLLKKYPKSPHAPDAMIRIGEAQNEQQKWEAADKTFTDFLANYPNDRAGKIARFGIGWSLENRQKYADARAAYNQVIASDNSPIAAHAQFQIGETYLSEQNFDKAIPALLAVEDVYAYPEWSARALYEAGRAFEQIKQPDQAKKQYSTVVTKYKQSPEAALAQDRLNALHG